MQKIPTMDWGILVHIMKRFTLNDGTVVTSYTEGNYVTPKAEVKAARGSQRHTAPPKAAPKPVRKGLYEVLGVEPTATAADIRRAYRKLAVVHHPDKGGDEEKFREISAAYKTLSDEEKRKRYDAFGEADDDACDDFLSKFAEVFSSDLFSEFDIKITTE